MNPSLITPDQIAPGGNHLYYGDNLTIMKSMNSGSVDLIYLDPPFNSQRNRNKRSVWTIATAPFPEAHFATFPPALVEPCILAGSKPGDLVLDPFIGSGTTAMVARNLGRRAIGIDLNPEYLDLARRRICPQVAMELE